MNSHFFSWPFHGHVLLFCTDTWCRIKFSTNEIFCDVLIDWFYLEGRWSWHLSSQRRHPEIFSSKYWSSNCYKYCVYLMHQITLNPSVCRLNTCFSGSEETRGISDLVYRKETKSSFKFASFDFVSWKVYNILNVEESGYRTILLFSFTHTHTHIDR